jgi:ABC-type lipoprotein release transport system permease subunit
MKGPGLASMAWRNLWRNKRRTLITLSSLAFGVMLATLFTGMGDWRWTEVINFAARMGNGHVTVLHPEFIDRPSLKRTITGVDAKVALIRDTTEVEHVAVRISGQVMLSTATQSSGGMFVAFDPRQENEHTLAFANAIGEGKMFEGPKGRGIVLGKLLAENLEVSLGKKVVYTLTDKQGDIVNGMARVTGLVETGSPTIDLGVVVLPIDTMREVLGYESDEATHIAVFLDNQRDSHAVAGALNGALDQRSAAFAWDETQAELAAFIAMKVWGLLVFEILILVLIAAGIFNTLFVSVMERLREFGILMAIGFSPGRLFRLVVWESAWLAAVGLALGALVTAVPYYLMSTRGIDLSKAIEAGQGDDLEVAGVVMEPILRVGIFPESVVAIAVIILGATLLSGLYPAWRAGRVNPVDTIKLV